ncbi:MAG: hypothetical protein EXR62_17475 [Chloroflexi bacterium]|nr:hypothetical protein [Chloroflexota bacterium]
MRRFQAILAALMITGAIAAGMWAVGADAAMNALTLPGSNTTAAPAPVEMASTSPDQAAAQVAQYQSREKQYQQQLNEATQKLAQANQQIQQYQTQLNDASQRLSEADQQIQQFQTILTELQRRGLIRIAQDGTITLPRR